mgnify:CR=1 FL=1
MSTGALIAKLASVVLSDERGRKAVGWILVAVFSPLILIIALLCSLGSGSANHNNAAVDACFYGGSFSAQVPAEYQTYVTQMRSAFSVLDTSISSVNAEMENGSLDPVRIKAIFYALCFGDSAPSQRAANRFVECFYTTEERTREVAVLDEEGNPTYDEDGNAVTEEETYTVALPCSLATAYANLASELGRSITEDDYKNIDHIYKRIAGSVDSGVYGLGDYERGTGYGVEIDISGYIDPGRKNAADLATYAIHAWEQGWGYVWGTCGWVLTDSLFQSKLNQYPDGVGDYEDFIRANWLGGRTTDCVGLIKGYGWLDTETLTVGYGTNGMPDLGANHMFYAATVTGTIDTIPEKPGLAVWRDGHIGVYIGGGYVIEAMGTKYGVVKTKLSERSFTNWLEIPYIDYD